MKGVFKIVRIEPKTIEKLLREKKIYVHYQDNFFNNGAFFEYEKTKFFIKEKQGVITNILVSTPNYLRFFVFIIFLLPFIYTFIKSPSKFENTPILLFVLILVFILFFTYLADIIYSYYNSRKKSRLKKLIIELLKVHVVNSKPEINNS